MTAISATDAAFSVFPFARMNRDFVIRYLAISAPFGWISSVVSELALGDYLTEVDKIARSGVTPSPEVAARLVQSIDLPTMLLGMLITLPISAALLGMALRKTVLNTETGRFGLAFGRLELLLLLGSLLMGIGLTLTSIVIASVSGLGGPLGLAIGLTGVVLVLLLALGRLGLWGVVTTETGRLGFAGSWAATGKVFWSLVGSFALWFLAFMVAFMFFSLLLGIITGGEAAMLEAARNDRLFALSFPGAISGLLNGAVSGVFSLGVVCVGAYAWHQMKANQQPAG